MGGEKAVNITIRPAIAEDADSLTAIQKQAFERLYKIYQDEASPYLRGSDEIKYQIVSGTRDIYKIFADDELCGGIAVRSKGNGEYYLNRVYVLPQLQGLSSIIGYLQSMRRTQLQYGIPRTELKIIFYPRPQYSINSASRSFHFLPGFESVLTGSCSTDSSASTIVSLSEYA